jgi:hypothetical protein
MTIEPLLIDSAEKLRATATLLFASAAEFKPFLRSAAPTHPKSVSRTTRSRIVFSAASSQR